MASSAIQSHIPLQFPPEYPQFAAWLSRISLDPVSKLRFTDSPSHHRRAGSTNQLLFGAVDQHGEFTASYSNLTNFQLFIVIVNCQLLPFVCFALSNYSLKINYEINTYNTEQYTTLSIHFEIMYLYFSYVLLNRHSWLTVSKMHKYTRLCFYLRCIYLCK